MTASVPAGRIQSVERAALVLRAFESSRQSLTLNDLAALLGVHKSTASRIVSTLTHAGLLARSGPDGAVALGPEIRRLGRLAVDGADLAELAQPAMDDLAATTGETVTLAVAEGADALTIAESAGTYLVGVRVWIGRRTPLELTSDGRVLLAFDAAGADGADGAEQVPLDQTARALVRSRGWAAVEGTFEEGLNGVAVPVFAPSGRCHAALCVSGPAYRVTPERFAPLADACRRAADAIVRNRENSPRQHR